MTNRRQLDRREVLRLMSAAGAAVLCSPLACKSGAARYMVAGIGKKTDGTIGVVKLSGSDVSVEHVIKIGFQPHSFFQDPRHPERIWSVEKWGKGAAVVDIKAGRLLHGFEAPDDNEYYGHGFMTPDRVAFVTRVSRDTGLGYLVGYDADDFHELASVEATLGGLHQAELLADGTVLVASSGIRRSYDGPSPRVEPTAMVRVDLSSGKRVDIKPVADDTQFISHFHRMKNDSLLVLSAAPREHDVPQLYYGHLEQPELRRVVMGADDGNFVTEMLSVAVDEDETLAVVTDPGSKVAVLIDPHTGAYLGKQPSVSKSIVYDTVTRGFILAGADGILTRERGRDAAVVATKTTQPFVSSHASIFVA